MTTQNVAWPMMMVMIPKSTAAVAERGVERHAGDDARQRDGQEQQKADRLAAEEPEAMDREGGESAQDQRDGGGAEGRADGRVSASADAGLLECALEPLEAEARAAATPGSCSSLNA